MRILQVIPYFPPAYAFGGPVKAVYQISKELTCINSGKLDAAGRNVLKILNIKI